MKQKLKPFMSIPEVAEYYQCTPAIVRKIVAAGKLRSYRLHDTGDYRILREDVIKHIEDQLQ